MIKKRKLLSSMLLVTFVLQFCGMLECVSFINYKINSYALFMMPMPIPPPITTGNLAAGKQARVYTDSEQKGYSASNANDNNTSTRWCAKDGKENHFITIDLGKFYNLTGTVVYWKKAVGKVSKYKIEVSSNNFTWTLKADRTDNENIDDIFTDKFFANYVRYVRVTATELDEGVWASINEIYVYDSIFAAPTNTPTNIQTNTPTIENTNTPSSIQTSTPTKVTTNTLAPTPTQTQTQGQTQTPTPTQTPIQTPANTSTPTSTSRIIAYKQVNYDPIIPSDTKLIKLQHPTQLPYTTPVKIYGSQNLVYTIDGNIDIQSAEKTKEIVLAIDNSYSTGITKDSKILNERIFDYTLFAGDQDITNDNMLFSTTSFSVQGNVHSNGKIGFYTASYSAFIDGNIQASEKIFAQYQTFKNGVVSSKNADVGTCTKINATVNTNSTVNQITGLVPLSRDILRKKASEDGKLYPPNVIGSVVFQGQSVNLNSPIHVEDDLTISTGNYTGKGLISAEGNISLSGINVSQDSGGALCIYSEKDVNLSCESGSIYGLVYAPNGTVNLSGTNFTFYGRIIAKKINSSSGNIKIIDRGYPTLVEELKNYIDCKLSYEKDAVLKFIQDFEGTNTKIGIVVYSDKAIVTMDNNNYALLSMNDPIDVAYLKKFVNDIKYSSVDLGGAGIRNIGDCLRKSYHLLNNSPDINAQQYLVVLTDGDTNVWSKEASSSVNWLKNNQDAVYISGSDKEGAKNYAAYFGSILKNASVKSYYIDISGASTDLEDIAIASGSQIVSTKHYYIPSAVDQILTELSKPTEIIKNEKAYVEYADDLDFTSVQFSDVIPLGVKVLSVSSQSSESIFSFSKITDGAYAGRYRVDGILEGLVLHKVNTGSNGLLKYVVKQKNTVVDESGNISYEISPVYNIKVKVKYMALYGPRTKIGNKTYSDVSYFDNVVGYIDYFGNINISPGDEYIEKVVSNPDTN